MICEIALVLMLDASHSIEPAQWRQQTHYTAEAIRSPEVISAIERIDGLAILTGRFGGNADTVLEWRVLRTRQDAEAYAAEIETVGRGTEWNTSIGSAIRHARETFNNVPCEPTRRIVDISTDGVDANVRFSAMQRDLAFENEITINVIGVGPIVEMDTIREHIVTPNGFAIEARTWDEYPLRFRRKLLMELTSR